MRVARLEWGGENPIALAGELRTDVGVDDIGTETAAILAAVREQGDAGLREMTSLFDGVELEAPRVDPAAIEAAYAALDPALCEALDLTASNVHRVAEAQLAPTVAVELSEGQTVSIGAAPVGSAGIYAPGGRAAYPSSVVMCVVPARVAGVGRIAVCSPPDSDGAVHPLVLAACALVGVDEVYAVGGAQAIAALAYGTESIAPVDVVAGPGNRYVNEAKRIVSGLVGIDGLAGPSELVVVLDGETDPEHAALDLCAQAEHGSGGLLVALASDADALDALAAAVERLAAGRESVTEALLTLIEAPSLESCLALADALAPEHLQLMQAGAGEELAAERVAGCVFVGPGAATVFGDYAAGSNHVLPTGGSARFGGPLGPATFLRRSAVVSLPAASAAALAPRTAALARAEGFPVHAESAEARSKP